MYYIISKLNFSELEKYKVNRTGFMKNPDFSSFFKTEEGKEFLKLDPIRIEKTGNIEDVIFSLPIDLSFLSMCYNCPLYIYVLDKKTYHKKLNLHMNNHLSLEKVEEFLNSKFNDTNELPKSSTYYNGDENSMSEALRKILYSTKSKNFEILLTKENGFELKRTNI